MAPKISPSIYLNPIPVGAPDKAPQVIGSIWANLKLALATNSNRDAISLMGKLGVTEADKQAHEVLIPMLQKALNPNVVIEPSSDPTETGVYFLSLDGEKFAVFKIGEKRARTELLVRHVAHMYGLEKHAIAGLFCSIANPKFSEEETIVELWNGGVKIISPEKPDQVENLNSIFPNLNFEKLAFPEDDELTTSGSSSALTTATASDDENTFDYPTTITGILEPFLPEEEISSDDFVKMVILASLIGLRDGKKDGNLGSVMVDTADSFVNRIEPPATDNPDLYQASLHIPFLGDDLANAPISKDAFTSIMKALKREDLTLVNLISTLQSQTVMFADMQSELTKLSFSQNLESDDDLEEMVLDHGNNRVEIEREKPKNAYEIVPDPIEVTDQATPMLTRNQIDAFFNRFMRLKIFLENCEKKKYLPNSKEIVSKIDPHYAAHLHALENTETRGSPCELVGWITPRGTNVSVHSSSPSLPKGSPPSFTAVPPLRSSSDSLPPFHPVSFLNLEDYKTQ